MVGFSKQNEEKKKERLEPFVQIIFIWIELKQYESVFRIKRCVEICFFFIQRILFFFFFYFLLELQNYL